MAVITAGDNMMKKMEARALLPFRKGLAICNSSTCTLPDFHLMNLRCYWALQPCILEKMYRKFAPTHNSFVKCSVIQKEYTSLFLEEFHYTPMMQKQYLKYALELNLPINEAIEDV